MAGTRAVMGSYSHGAGGNSEAMAQQRGLTSQWSFSRQDMMPHISEMGVVAGMPADIGESIGTGGNGSSDLSRSFSMGSWDDANSFMFSSPSKKAKVLVDGDDAMVRRPHLIYKYIYIHFIHPGCASCHCLFVTTLAEFLQFGLSSSSLEMPGMDDYLQLQQDSIACRVRAKRGCATHPRSIAERVSFLPH